MRTQPFLPEKRTIDSHTDTRGYIERMERVRVGKIASPNNVLNLFLCYGDPTQGSRDALCAEGRNSAAAFLRLEDGPTHGGRRQA